MKFTKKQKKYAFFVVLGIIAVGVLLKINSPLSLISIPAVYEKNQTFSFDGISGVAYSPYFGSVSNFPKSVPYDYAIPGYRMDLFKESFCGNDGDVTISNDLTDGGSLEMSSSITTYKQACSTNYIRSEFQIPAGTLKWNCITSVTSDPQGYGDASCEVDGQNGDSGEIIYDSSKNIKVSTFASAGDGGYSVKSSATLTLDFTAIPTIQNISVYRFEENCSLMKIPPIEKNIGDFDTLVECQKKLSPGYLGDGGANNPSSSKLILYIIGLVLLLVFLFWLYKKTR